MTYVEHACWDTNGLIHLLAKSGTFLESHRGGCNPPPHPWVLCHPAHCESVSPHLGSGLALWFALRKRRWWQWHCEAVRLRGCCPAKRGRTRGTEMPSPQTWKWGPPGSCNPSHVQATTLEAERSCACRVPPECLTHRIMNNPMVHVLSHRIWGRLCSTG